MTGYIERIMCAIVTTWLEDLPCLWIVYMSNYQFFSYNLQGKQEKYIASRVIKIKRKILNRSKSHFFSSSKQHPLYRLHGTFFYLFLIYNFPALFFVHFVYSASGESRYIFLRVRLLSLYNTGCQWYLTMSKNLRRTYKITFNLSFYLCGKKL